MRRFRPQKRFGPVSLRERQNADLFFADLTGHRAPAQPGREDTEQFVPELATVPEFAAEDASESSALVPYEAEAYAEAEASGDSETYAEAEAYAEAEPEDAPKAATVAKTNDPNEIIVTRADGSKIHVHRKVRAKIMTRPGQLRAGFCTDDNRVFLRLRWCEGTQGTIDLGANPQEAFKLLMEKVFKQISQGDSVDKIKQAIEGASVQAFVEVDITKIRDFKITGDIRLDINKSGIKAGTGKVTADTGWLKLGVEVKVGADGKQVMVTGEIPLERRKIKGKECPVRELALWWDVECSREIPFTWTTPPLVPYDERHERLFLYFEKAKDILRLDPKVTPTPKDEVAAILQSSPTAGTAKLNKRTLEKLDNLVGQDYWLTSIDGFTSPEGSRPKPTNAALAARWEGNDALSTERAEKVRKLIAARYSSWVRIANMPGQPPVMVFPPGETMPTAVGRSENPKLDTKLGKELEGAALDNAIINGDAKLGVKPFLVDHPEELTFMTDPDDTFVLDPKNTVRHRAERVFENLRRVEIHLKFKKKMPGTTHRDFTLDTIPCPKDVIDAAEREWGSRTPFIKKDTPICL